MDETSEQGPRCINAVFGRRDAYICLRQRQAERPGGRLSFAEGVARPSDVGASA